MTIPTAGDITSEMARAEWRLSYPMTSAGLAAAANLSLPLSSDQLRGKSAFAVEFTIGAQQDVIAGSPASGNRRRYKLLSAVVVGSGSYTYAWSVVSGAVASAFFGATNASTAQWSQPYNTFDDASQYEAVTLKLTVTDTVAGLTLTATHVVTIND